MPDAKREVLERLLEERSEALHRPARTFLTNLLQEPDLLDRMHFCRPEERSRLRNSVLIATEEAPCWSVLLGNEPGSGPLSAAARARLALEGLDLTPADLVARLRTLPVWFLALDPPFAPRTDGDAMATEHTLASLAQLDLRALRERALMDQIDAALDQGDIDACKRLRAMMG